MTVAELFEEIAPLVDAAEVPVTKPILTCVNGITSAITKYLWRFKSDLLRAEATLTFAALTDPAVQPLPTGFLGLSQHPYVEADTNVLTKFDQKAKPYYAGDTGTLDFYRVVNTNLQVWPVPTEETVVTLEYYLKPVPLTLITEDIPFSGLFDDVYKDGTLMIQTGDKALFSQAFIEYIAVAVRDTLFMRQDPSQEFTDSTY